MSSNTEKELKKLYSDRVKDSRQSKTKRRARIDQKPQPFGQILPKFFTGNPQSLKKIEETRALIAWEKYVGESAALQSQAIRLRSGTLTVKVLSPLWMQQLLLLKERILKHYRRDFPSLNISNIFFTR